MFPIQYFLDQLWLDLRIGPLVRAYRQIVHQTYFSHLSLKFLTETLDICKVQHSKSLLPRWTYPVFSCYRIGADRLYVKINGSGFFR